MQYALRFVAFCCEIVIFPTSISSVRPLDDELRVGLGLFVAERQDFVLRTGLEDARPDGQRLDLRLDQGVEGSRYHAIAGLARSFGANLHLGLGLHVAYLSMSENTQAAAALVDPETRASDDFVVQTLQSSSLGVSVALSAGGQWQPTPQRAFGASVVGPFWLVYSSVGASTFALSTGLGQPSGAAIDAPPESSAVKLHH